MTVINYGNSFKKHQLYSLCKKCVDMHLKYYEDIEFRAFLANCCEATYFWSIISVIAKCITIFIIPTSVHFITANRELMWELYIPGIDASKSPGFELLTLYHVSDSLIALVELILYELQILGICINIRCLGNILIHKVETLSYDSENLDKELNHIFVIYNEYIELIDSFNGAFNIIISLKFFTSVFSISFALFIVQLVSSFKLYLISLI